MVMKLMNGLNNLKKNKMKQTAIEWLVEQLQINNYISDNAHWLIDEAKEMEKDQLICAGFFINKEKYYKDTYKSNLEPQLIPRKEYLSIKQWFKQFK
jgi:hypothetical protein